MSTLAEALVCDASNVTGIVDKLESRGLIVRQGMDTDRRVKQLAVTEQGRRIRDQLVAAVMNPPAAVAALPADVKTRMTNLLRGLLTAGGCRADALTANRSRSAPQARCATMSFR